MSLEDYRLSFREAGDVLARRLKEPAPGRIQLLAGPHQLGKTTLLLEVAEGHGKAAIHAAADGPEAALPGFWERFWARRGDCRERGNGVRFARRGPSAPRLGRAVRELLQDLRALGCQPERTLGSYQIWCTPGGTLLPPGVVKPRKRRRDVMRLVLSSIRRVLRREGLRLPSEQGKGQA